MMTCERWKLMGCVVGGALLLVPSESRAGATDTNSKACGRTSSAWNAPNGALVLVKSRGIVEGVLGAVGEHFTHSMLSHGPGAYVTHSTMYTPGTTGWPTFCSTPIKPGELRDGYPGAAQTSQGGAYAYLYVNGNPESVIFQRSADRRGFNTRGESVANWLWADAPYSSERSRQDGSQWIYRLRHHENGQFFPYVLYQYRDQEGLNQGASAWRNGSVCSTFLAYAHHVTGNGTLAPHVYDHQQMLAAGAALYGQVEDRCHTETDFLLDAASTVGCFENICDDAARQVRNCMARGICDSDNAKRWTEVANNPSTVSVSISPDRLGGWSGHPWTGSQASIWAYDPGSEIQWNSAGDMYGCWF